MSSLRFFFTYSREFIRHWGSYILLIVGTNIVLEMGYATDLHREALIATAVVLFVFILIINLSFSLIKKKSN